MIDLSSDTATRPSDAMRDAIHKATVGDDQRGEDPTVNALQDLGCELLGKEAALFLPSATQANQIAIRIQTRPGDEVICAENCHIQKYESGGPAVLSGVLLRPLHAPRGIFTADQLTGVMNPPIPHAPPTRMVCIENTHNYAGGIVWDEPTVRAVTDTAHANGLATHLDGARLVNAAVARGCDLSEIAAPFQTVTLCLSKGLGAPAGALLLGPAALINEARRWKHVFGGRCDKLASLLQVDFTLSSITSQTSRSITQMHRHLPRYYKTSRVSVWIHGLRQTLFTLMLALPV